MRQGLRHPVAWRRFHYPDETVAATVKSLDEARPVGCVLQNCPEAGNRISHTVFKVDKCIGWPEFRSQFLPRDEAARVSEEDGQQLERTALHWQTDSVAAQFSGTKIQFEGAEANDLCGVLGRHLTQPIP